MSTPQIRRCLLLAASGFARFLLVLAFLALATGAYVLLWRDVRYVAHTVNAWVDRVTP